MSIPRRRSTHSDLTVQLYRRPCGGLAYKPDRLPLRAGEMLIGRGLQPAEAIAFMCEHDARRGALGPEDGVVR